MNSGTGYTVLIPDPLAMGRVCLFIFLGHVWVLVGRRLTWALSSLWRMSLKIDVGIHFPSAGIVGSHYLVFVPPQVWNTESHFVVTWLRAQNVDLSHPPRLGFRQETAPTPTFWLCLRLSLESHLFLLAPQLLIKSSWLIACSRGYTIYFTHDWIYCLGFICREVNRPFIQILVVCFIFITYSKDKYLTAMLKK